MKSRQVPQQGAYWIFGSDLFLISVRQVRTKGKVPNITPAAMNWSDIEVLDYLVTGMTPDFDSVGGEMVDVVDNLAQLPEEDVEAIVAYLKAIPAIE